MVQSAIALGVAKVNVNTECQLVFAEATRGYIEAKKDLDEKAKGFDPRKLLKPGCEAIKAKCIEKFKVFGSFGKA
jgi:fructose-bisphosphate aldolase class II